MLPVMGWCRIRVENTGVLTLIVEMVPVRLKLDMVRFKGEFITITPPLVHLRSEVAATFAQPIDSRDTKLATPQTVVSATSGRWGRLHAAEVLTAINAE